MQVIPTEATLGAVVRDVDLVEADDAVFAAIEDAWHKHAVLVFEGQSLADDEHLALWDNRCVLHRGHPWPLDQARDMVRSTVAGDAIDNEWAAIG